MYILITWLNKANFLWLNLKLHKYGWQLNNKIGTQVEFGQLREMHPGEAFDGFELASFQAEDAEGGEPDVLDLLGDWPLARHHCIWSLLPA